MLNSDYPQDKLHVFIGSDASTDNSNEIIKRIEDHEKRIKFFAYSHRRGKAKVINELVQEAFSITPESANHILLFTDANVILLPKVCKMLCRHYTDPRIALVDSRISPLRINTTGISYSETQYINLESKIKYLEGKLWGAMMGAFGGCFSLRSTYFQPVPDGFLVDDFYISMNALKNGGLCMNDLDAVCHEGMPDQINEEFKRKARISAGNFQNLSIFYNVLFEGPVSVAYAFLSHKVLRWLGPFFILIVFFSSFCLSLYFPKPFQFIFISITLFLIILPLFDYLISKLGFHNKILRGIRYFMLMNLALLFGFINYLKGIKVSSWEPPKRSMI